MNNQLYKGIWIEVIAGGFGIVKRVSRTKEWVDVNFGQWSKRMPYDSVKPLTVQRYWDVINGVGGNP